MHAQPGAALNTALIAAPLTVSPVSRQVAWKTTPNEPFPTILSVE
jgi:hypothetical protein